MTIAVVCLVLVLALLVVSMAFNIKHARLILEVEDALGESLDVCDQAYGRMTEVLDMPVALNTPEVRQVLRQIEGARASILYVSNVLAAPFGGIEDAPDDEEA